MERKANHKRADPPRARIGEMRRITQGRKHENSLTQLQEDLQTIRQKQEAAESELVSQEHRLYYLVRNFIHSFYWDRGDPRKQAARVAFAMRLLFFGAAGGGLTFGGVISCLTYMELHQQNITLVKQTKEMARTNTVALRQTDLQEGALSMQCQKEADCDEHGRCEYSQGQCIATHRSCYENSPCDIGRCTARGDGRICITTNQVCYALPLCKVLGYCKASEDTMLGCVVDEQGCMESEICKQLGLCSANISANRCTRPGYKYPMHIDFNEEADQINTVPGTPIFPSPCENIQACLDDQDLCMEFEGRCYRWESKLTFDGQDLQGGAWKTCELVRDGDIRVMYRRYGLETVLECEEKLPNSQTPQPDSIEVIKSPGGIAAGMGAMVIRRKQPNGQQSVDVPEGD